MTCYISLRMSSGNSSARVLCTVHWMRKPCKGIFKFICLLEIPVRGFYVLFQRMRRRSTPTPPSYIGEPKTKEHSKYTQLNTFTFLMLKFAKRPFPMIGKISELLVSGNRAGFSDTGTSPRSPLDLKMQPSPSPRGLKSYDVGGVGLGIVAALEKSALNGREILAKYGVFCPNTNRSDPIPVNSGKNSDGFSSRGGQEFEEDSLENYTYVTLRGQNKPCTKVYYDGGDCAGSAMHRPTGNGGLTICDDDLESSVFPTSDFLSCCHLCKKSLHGKDIYMYRGEKAFCSTECRSTQIIADERKEQCRSEALRSADASRSSCSREEIVFSTGILVI